MGDIAGDLGSADDYAGSVSYRRDGQGELDIGAILAAPDGFEMIDPLAAPYLREDSGLLVQTILRNEHCDRLADCLFGGIAEYPGRAGVPTLDAAGKILADD